MSDQNNEWPDYCVASLERRLANIRGQHKTKSVEDLGVGLLRAMREEVEAFRFKVDGKGGSGEFWYRVGYRAITTAWEREVLLARFKAALVDAVRVTFGHPVSPDSVHVYRRCPESPTGVSHVMSIDRDWPEVQELLSGVSLVPGGLGSKS